MNGRMKKQKRENKQTGKHVGDVREARKRPQSYVKVQDSVLRHQSIDAGSQHSTGTHVALAPGPSFATHPIHTDGSTRIANTSPWGCGAFLTADFPTGRWHGLSAPEADWQCSTPRRQRPVGWHGSSDPLVSTVPRTGPPPIRHYWKRPTDPDHLYRDETRQATGYLCV